MDNSKPQPIEIGKPAPAKGLKHFCRSCGYSANGFREAWKEAAFRQEIVLGIIILPLVYFLLGHRISSVAVLFMFWMGLLVTELLNTAIEAVVDLASPNYHELAKRAKDLASAAVTCAITANITALLWIVTSYFKR